jgi:hypothetical protein
VPGIFLRMRHEVVLSSTDFFFIYSFLHG